MALTMTGRDGSIVWGYYPAATVATWSLSAHTDTSATVTGVVTHADDFKLSQSGLTFRVTRQNGHVWTWPIIALHIADGTVTATVSLQE